MPPPSGTQVLPGLQSDGMVQPSTQIVPLLPPLPRQMPRPPSQTNVAGSVSLAVPHWYSPQVPPRRQRPTSAVQSEFASHGSPTLFVDAEVHSQRCVVASQVTGLASSITVTKRPGRVCSKEKRHSLSETQPSTQVFVAGEQVCASPEVAVVACGQ